jgi:hypothetical protein
MKTERCLLGKGCVSHYFFGLHLTLKFVFSLNQKRVNVSPSICDC